MQSSFQNDHWRYEGVGLDELDACAAHVLTNVKHAANLLEAPMGSGKTTMVNALLRAWGSEDHGSSPTFSLIEEHHGDDGVCYHLDAYRIEDEEEAYDIGLEEYFDYNDPIWIEWGGKVRSLLPEDVGVIYIEMVDEDHRNIVFYPSMNLHQIHWNNE
ncbi:MAG: tRNA ((37)-N6)-threonylcarbamoyltransferase complex ATPase subunit type 1 TsaE [Bacteroidota bacterium]|jgi:tRNA threonylcarbamoyladenosine biosynthesis protein TsaE